MASHEQELFSKVIELREGAMGFSGSPAATALRQNELVKARNQFLARVEAYPELRSATAFLQLQRELVDTEDRIAAARRFYNANVRDFNTMLQSFPAGMIGRSAGHKEQELYDAEDLAIRNPVRVYLAASVIIARSAISTSLPTFSMFGPTYILVIILASSVATVTLPSRSMIEMRHGNIGAMRVSSARASAEYLPLQTPKIVVGSRVKPFSFSLA